MTHFPHVFGFTLLHIFSVFCHCIYHLKSLFFLGLNFPHVWWFLLLFLLPLLLLLLLLLFLLPFLLLSHLSFPSARFNGR
ncbi:MAG TPA: hypothetical protein ENO18_06340 [Caldithrix sp.]|nr:hypothetical protein [Caldithrix sp.]